MSAIKKTISINEDIAKEAAALNPNFSSVVEAALIEYIQHHRVKMAINSFGKWSDREESSAEMVAKLRSRDDREPNPK